MNITFDSIYGDILSRLGRVLPFSFDTTALYPRSKTETATFAEVLAEVVEEAEGEDEAANAAADAWLDETREVYGNANYGAIGGKVITDEIYDAILENAAKQSLDVNLVKAVIQQESGFYQYSTSTSGAMGLMQLMPFTAEGLGVTDAYDVNQNIAGGTAYLRQMLDMFGNDVSLALAAYNAGPNAVLRYGGIPPYAETLDYVPKVLGYQAQYAAEMSAV